MRLRRHRTERVLRQQQALRRLTVLRLPSPAQVAHLRHAYDRHLRVVQGFRPWVGRCRTFSLWRRRTNRSRLAATVRGRAPVAAATASLVAWWASSTRLTMAPGQSTLIGRLGSRLANSLRRSLKVEEIIKDSRLAFLDRPPSAASRRVDATAPGHRAGVRRPRLVAVRAARGGLKYTTAWFDRPLSALSLR